MKTSVIHLVAAVGLSATMFADNVTFAEHIAPIVFERCASCHRAGEAAPFSLTSYASVKRRAKTIQRVVSERYMPPWHVDPGWGEFRGNPSLGDEEIDIFNRWVESGTPEGRSCADTAVAEVSRRLASW